MTDSTKWQLLMHKMTIYKKYVEKLRKRKGIVAALQYQKHAYFITQLEKVVEDINNGKI